MSIYEKCVRHVKFLIGILGEREVYGFDMLPSRVKEVLSMFNREDDVFIVTYKEVDEVIGYEFDFGDEAKFFPDPDYTPEDLPYEDLAIGSILEILCTLDPGDSVWVMKSGGYLHFSFKEDYIKAHEFLDSDLYESQPLLTMKMMGKAEFTFY